jgi:DNA modification methylase
MPESVKDRLSKTHESVFLFVKQRRYHFELDEIREPYAEATLERVNHSYSSDTKSEHSRVKSSGSRRFAENVRSGKNNGKNPGDVWEINTVPFKGAHFAVFPPDLVEPMIKAGCPPDGIVLDPFSGSGTTCRVARKLGRYFIGIDLNPEYVNMAEGRVKTDNYKPPPENVESLLDVFGGSGK